MVSLCVFTISMDPALDRGLQSIHYCSRFIEIMGNTTAPKVIQVRNQGRDSWASQLSSYVGSCTVTSLDSFHKIRTVLICICKARASYLPT